MLDIMIFMGSVCAPMFRRHCARLCHFQVARSVIFMGNSVWHYYINGVQNVAALDLGSVEVVMTV